VLGRGGGKVIKSRKLRWTGHVAHVKYNKHTQNSIGKPKRKTSLGRMERRRKNIKVVLTEKCYGGSYCTINWLRTQPIGRLL